MWPLRERGSGAAHCSACVACRQHPGVEGEADRKETTHKCGLEVLR